MILTTAIGHEGSVPRAVYALSEAGLLVLALVSLFTGFKVKLVPFKLCPVIFTASAAWVLAGTYL